MKIIILGAGQVGTTLAANLVSEDNDITLVDNESQHLQNLQDKHDLRVVKGSPASRKTLGEEGEPLTTRKSCLSCKFCKC